jgi:hypothetical protein
MALGSWIQSPAAGGGRTPSPWLPRPGAKRAATTPAATSVASAAEGEAVGSSGAVWLWAFPLVIALPTELSLNLGGLRLTPYRIVLLACFFPCLLQVLQGEQVKRRAADLWATLFGLWAVLALAVRNGPI